MTKRRDPLSPSATVKLVADRIGWARLCVIVGRAERTVRHWSDPDIATCVSLDAAIKLDRAFMGDGGDYPPFFCLFEAQLALDDGAISSCHIARARRAADAAEEAGEAVASQIRAWLPGATRADLALAELETKEAIVALARTLPDLGTRVPA